MTKITPTVLSDVCLVSMTTEIQVWRSTSVSNFTLDFPVRGYDVVKRSLRPSSRIWGTLAKWRPRNAKMLCSSATFFKISRSKEILKPGPQFS